jgi:hypothetical protein
VIHVDSGQASSPRTPGGDFDALAMAPALLLLCAGGAVLLLDDRELVALVAGSKVTDGLSAALGSDLGGGTALHVVVLAAQATLFFTAGLHGPLR